MPKLGKGKPINCPGCGRKVKLVYIGKGEWKGTCRCGKTTIEIESDPTKTAGGTV